MLAVVAVVGIPSAWRNPTAAALVLCWIVSQSIYIFTGNGLAVEYYTYPDAFVVAVIFTKAEYCNLDPQSMLEEIKCILLERSPADRFILCTYPVCWYFYVAEIPPFYTYWALWLLAVAQFLAAGFESLSKSIRRASSVSETSGPSDDVFRRLAWVQCGVG